MARQNRYTYKGVFKLKKLLLTGFEPFLAFPVNPTMQIVGKLDGTVIGDYKVYGKILSVNFNAFGEELLTHINEEKPDAVLSLGLAGGRYKITPERVALNVKDGEPDNEGHQPIDESIEEGGPAAYFSTLPIREMVNRLSGAGLPAAISNSAGTYLCNNVMYAGLHSINRICHQDFYTFLLHLSWPFSTAKYQGGR